MMDLILSPGRSIKEQVASHFRDQIRQGILKPGDQLLPAKQIARELNVAEANIQHALALLAKEGLIARQRHVGSVVLEPRKKMQHVVFFIPWLFLERGEEYTRLLSLYVNQELAGRKISCRVIYDSPDGAGRRYLSELTEKREIQGVICRHIDCENIEYIQSLGVFFSGITALMIPAGVTLIVENLIDYIVDEISRMNLKTIGVLIGESKRQEEYQVFEDYILRKFNSRGIELRKEWIYNADIFNQGMNIVDSALFGWKGIEYFQALLTQPQGLILFSDDLIYGLSMACYHYHIAIPEKYQIFVHHTRENPVLFPFPCTLFQQSIHEISKYLVENLIDLSEGKILKKRNLAVWTKIVN